MADLQALKTELAAGHPTSGAYNADATIAASEINAANRTRNLTSLTGDAMFGATDGTEFGALTDHKQAVWVSFCGRADVDPFGASNVAFVQWVFGGGSTTVTALAALRTETVSRAVELGLGNVRPGTVEHARALP